MIRGGWPVTGPDLSRGLDPTGIVAFTVRSEVRTVLATDRVARRLAAILAIDMVGYSRHMESDEAGTIARQRSHRRELIDPVLNEQGGRIVKTTGDGLLVEFGSVVDALDSAVRIQRTISETEADAPRERRIQYRAGINLGDIVIDGDDIVGDGVNIAARLEGLAEPGGISITASVFEQVVGKLDLVFDDLGDLQVKNIQRPVRVYRVRMEIVDNAGQGSPGSVAGVAAKPSIAVLPFQDMSAEQTRSTSPTASLRTSSPGCRATTLFSSRPAIHRSPTRAGRWT